MMLTPEQLEYLRGMRFEASRGGLSVGSDAIVAHIDAQQARIAELEQDAARYRWLMANYARGDGWQQIDDALNYGEADTKLSPAIDAAMQK